MKLFLLPLGHRVISAPRTTPPALWPTILSRVKLVGREASSYPEAIHPSCIDGSHLYAAQITLSRIIAPFARLSSREPIALLGRMLIYAITCAKAIRISDSPLRHNPVRGQPRKLGSARLSGEQYAPPHQGDGAVCRRAYRRSGEAQSTAGRRHGRLYETEQS